MRSYVPFHIITLSSAMNRISQSMTTFYTQIKILQQLVFQQKYTYYTILIRASHKNSLFYNVPSQLWLPCTDTTSVSLSMNTIPQATYMHFHPLGIHYVE